MLNETLLGERKPAAVSGTPDRLMSVIKPLLSSQLVAEFNCIYKFVVMDELQAVHVYHLDLKHGLYACTFSTCSSANVTFKMCVIFGVQFDRRKVDKEASLHEN